MRILVYGAYGHTGNFVVTELRRRGLHPILSGRAVDRLAALDGETRPATVDDPTSLDRALAGVDAVINCAGPFATTAAPLIDAALRAGIPYLDVTAELESVADTIAAYDAPARAAGVAVVPSVGFYGGLSDVLATAAVGDWPAVDRITVAYALNSWRPTNGTRATGKVSARRRDGGRLVFADGRLQRRSGEAPVLDWSFPAPVGARRVVGEFTIADLATIPHHLTVPDIDLYLNVEALADLVAADPTGPMLRADGRSDQTFLVEAIATRNGQTRRAVAAGRDIYAASAPLVVEATTRVLSARPVGVVTAGMLSDLLGPPIEGEATWIDL